MSGLVISRRFRDVHDRSGLPSIADVMLLRGERSIRAIRRHSLSSRARQLARESRGSASPGAHPALAQKKSGSETERSVFGGERRRVTAETEVETGAHDALG